MPPTAEEMLETVRKEVSTTQGLGTYNFTPFHEISEVTACVAVVSGERGDPNVFKETVEADPVGNGVVIAALVFSEDGDHCFIPWAAGAVLRGDSIGVPNPKMGPNLWWWPAVKTDSKSEITYVDNRTENLKKRPLKTFNFLVFMRLGVCRTTQQLHSYLKSHLSRESFWEEEAEDGPVVDKITISVQCPIMGTLIDTPVRPRKCGHPQVWDLNTHLLMLSEQRLGAKGIRCQICDTAYQFKDLVIDQTFLNLLADHSALKRNTVFSSGQWDAYKASRPSQKKPTQPDTPLPDVVRVGADLVRPLTPTTGLLLKPLLRKTTTYVQTGVQLPISPTAHNVPGSWQSYPNLPGEYFVLL